MKLKFVSVLAACLFCLTGIGLTGCSQTESEALPQGQQEAQQKDTENENLSLEGADSPTPEPEERSEPKQLRIVGYLPAGAMLSAGEEWEQNLKKLTDGILNTAAYWDEDGKVIVTEAFQPALERWDEQMPAGQKRWCTVNPQGSLIRSGAAGKTIDTPEKRQVLIQSLLDFCREYRFDGIDIDWEFPEEDEWEHFSRLAVEIKEAFEKEGRQLSLAFYPNGMKLSQEAVSAVDFINIMAYDQFDEKGYHSTYETAVEAVEQFLKEGARADQLVLGIPFYGRPTDQSAQWPYYISAEGLEAGQNLLDGVYYNGLELVKQKTAYGVEQGLSGVMLYHIYCDYPAEDPRSLTAAVAEGIGSVPQ